MKFVFGLDNFYFMAALILAECVHLWRSKRRRNFVLRAVISVVLLLCVSLIIPVADFDGDYALLYKFLVYIFIFILTLFGSVAVFDNDYLHAFNRCVHGVLTYACGRVWGLFFTTLFSLASPFSTIVRIGSYITSYLMFFAFSLTRFSKKLKKADEIFKNIFTLFLVMLVLMFICTADEYVRYNAVTNAVAVAVVYVGFYLLEVFSDDKKLQTEYIMLKSMMEKEAKQYEMSKELVEVINIKCHDMKHQIRKIRKNAESVDSALLDEVEKSLDEYDFGIKTGNEAFNIVMAEKGKYCADNEIKISCIADGQTLSFMAPTDIYSLMGNILDNAIEAVMRLEEQDKKLIDISLRSESGVVRIRVENYYNGALAFADDLPVTTKDDSYFHGYGVKSIKSIAEKYGGFVRFIVDDETFVINVIIPVPEVESAK